MSVRYSKVVPATFVRRPNRFIALVEIERTDGNRLPEGRPADPASPTVVHVKNTGRCRELLVPGVRVWLSESDNPARKTRYDLVAVEKRFDDGRPPLLVNMDSQIPNDVAEEWIRQGAGGLFSLDATVRREVFHGSSRFDFYIEDDERRAFLEVKGVTLEDAGEARFPDAPTLRGAKHLAELADCVRQGYEAYVLFVIQMKSIHRMRPNDETDPEFGRRLREAAAAGVKVLAMDCAVRPDSLEIDGPVQVRL